MKKSKGRKRVGKDSNSAKQGISRRRFLVSATAAGVAAGMPALFMGCGDDDDGSGVGATPTPTPTATPTPGNRPRELRTLNFDFSFGNLRDVRLQVLNSPSHRALLSEHTAESRARHRQLNPMLADVPDERLTHYIEDVDLPSDALQLLIATGADADTGEDVVAAVVVHVPTEASQAMGRRAAARGRNPLRSAKAQAYGLGQGADDTTIIDLLPAVNDFVTPWDTAVSLVFHSQEIMNLDVDQGSSILNMIETLPCSATDPSCTPYLGTLAFGIAEKWPATASGGWATLVPISDADGNPVLDDEGRPAYRYDLDDDIAQSVCAVAAQIKKAIFDDPEFEGTNWHPTEGMTVSQTTSASSLAAVGGAAAAGFAVTAAHPAGTSVHGVKFDSIKVTNSDSRTVEVQVRNAYLRYLAAYVQFANEGGDLPVQDPTSSDTERAKFLDLINSNYTILGIPLIGNDIPLSSVQFDVPADASIAKVYFGSLGLGGEAFSPEAVDGSIYTLIFNIGIPTIFLVAGVAVTSSLLKNLQARVGFEVVVAIRAELFEILGATAPEVASGIFGTGNSSNATAVLASLGNALLSSLFSTAAGKTLFEAMTDATLVQSTASWAGPVGLALRLVSIAADAAAIAESVVEVLASPAIFINQLCLTMTTTVTIKPDPLDFRFPATARNYEVTLTYDSASKVAHKQTGTLEVGQSDPIVVVFDNVPSGGMVTVDVYLTTETNCVVGRSTDADGNLGPFGPVSGTQAQIELTIKELVIPLTADTQYVHDLKLEYQDGQHVWMPTSAPTDTIADLMEGQDNALNDLTAITISQRTGMAGYAYQAGGQGVPFCGQTNTGIMHVFQNIFLAQDPDEGLKQLPCGFQQASGIVYDKLGPVSGMGRNFFLQPAATGFLLQSVTLDESTPFNVANPLTWGVFSQALDSLAVVPTGYVVGVDRQNHKMEIIELPSQPEDPVNAPQAVPFSVSKMGLGTRSGLLNAPVAVAVIDAAILILEDGNQRVQAVDVSGNPVLRFQNGTTSTVDLEKGSGIVYLDLGVEGMGYFYVLSFVNGGMTPADYRLDIYDPQGNFLTRTTGVAAARIAVDTFRNVYTLNYETIANAPRIEPSLSQWNPSTPGGCPTPTA